MGDPDNCFFFNLTTISQIFIKIAVLGYKYFMLENRNISINMGTEVPVVAKETAEIHVYIYKYHPDNYGPNL